MNTNKILRVSKVPLYIFLISLIICVVCVFGIIKLNEPEEIDKIYNYHELIVNMKDEEGIYAEVEFVSIPYKFAVYEGDLGDEYYYMVYDKNDYLYIVNLKEYTANMLIRQYEKNPEEFSYHMEGYLFKTEEECKELAIDYYNESYEEKIITDDNFTNFFGATYISEIKEPVDELWGILVVILSFSGIVGLIGLILFIMLWNNTRKTLKKYNVNELEGELQKSSTKRYEKLDLYLTDRYMIAKTDGLKVAEYKDITKICINRMPYNRIQLIVYLIDTKKIIATEVINSEDKRELLYEVANLMKEKNNVIEIKDSIAVTLTHNKEL